MGTKIEQLLPEKPGQLPEDRAQNIEAVLDWCRDMGIEPDEQPSDEEHKDLTARFAMEHAGDIYSRSKARAIKLDNIHKQHVASEKRNKTFEKVAEAAVKNFQKHQKSAAKPAPKAAAEKPKPASKCTNCVHLPKEYAKELGEEGSCADCDKWAAQNYCTEKKYAQFMSDYCAGSCLKKTGKCGHNPQ